MIKLNKYRKGYDLERKIKKHFEKQDYYVMRSSGSKGLFDLMVLDEARFINLIQLKNGLKISNKEKQKIELFAKKWNNTNCLIIQKENKRYLIEIFDYNLGKWLQKEFKHLNQIDIMW